MALSPFAEKLNKSQQSAVLHNHGPLLVLAGAGSGKTRVLTNRIARLVSEKVCSPSQILAVTFTNKAASEMQERIAEMVSRKSASLMTVSTFHSLGARILREHGSALGINKNFSILDDHQRQTILKQVVRSAGGKKMEDKHEEIATAISLAKNASMSPDNYVEKTEDNPRFLRIYKAYRSHTFKRQTIDFDDLLLLPLELFEKHPEILEAYRKRFAFFSIDEFQDTNVVQLKIARLLSAPSNNIMAVGDDDQGIYSWRGADINNIISFQVHFPNTTTVVLDTNYRSTKQILEAALAVVSKNRKRTIKNITAAAGDGELITVYKADDEIEEAEWICQTIIDHVKSEQYKFKDHALLMRTNAMMRRFEEEMRRKKMPYHVIGAMSFFDRKEIKDILAYLRFFANMSDEMSLLRLLKVPDRGIAPSTIEKLDELAGKRRMGLWEAFLMHNDVEMQSLQHTKCSELISFFHEHNPKFEKGELSLTMRKILQDCDYMRLLERASKDDATTDMRRENVEEILRGLESYETKMKDQVPNLVGYLQDLALVKNDVEDEEEQKRGGVRLMTLHKSKGLEFPVVFLSNLDDATMPSPRAILEGGIEEERRLFYVGMTRARKLLFLTYPAQKEFRKKAITVTPCRFIREIPDTYLNLDLMVEHEAEKQEFVTNFFEEMKKKFAEQGLESNPKK